MKKFAKWIVKVTATISALAVMSECMNWFEHKVLKDTKPLRRY